MSDGRGNLGVRNRGRRPPTRRAGLRSARLHHLGPVPALLAAQPAGAFEIVAHRSLWSLIFLAIVVSVQRQWRVVGTTFATPRTRWLLLAAAVLVSANWTAHIWAVNTDHVVEASLGYFINPWCRCCGVLAFGERLRRAQWWAVGLGGVSVAADGVVRAAAVDRAGARRQLRHLRTGEEARMFQPSPA